MASTLFKPVRTFSCDYEPFATCEGIEGKESCDRSWPVGRSTRDLVKDHVATTGHTVQVTRSTIDVYRGEPR